MQSDTSPTFGAPIHLENVEFVQACPVQFRCRKCSSVDAALYRAKCGHGFCGRCVNLFRAARFQCPVDSRSVEKKELVPDKEIVDYLLQLNIYCLQRKRGCKRTVVFKDLENHLESCGYVPVTCPCGCGLQISKRDLAHHLTTTCERRLVNCDYCQDEVVFKYLQDHYGICNKWPITCPHCKEEVKREQLPNHETACPMKSRTCRLLDAGCPFKGTVEELQNHEKDVANHVAIMATIVGECRNYIKELEKKVNDTNEENKKLKEQFQDIYPILASIKIFEKTISTMKEKIKKLEIAEQTVEEMNETLHRMKEFMQRMQPAVVQDHKSKSPSDMKSPECKSPSEIKSPECTSPTGIKSPECKSPLETKSLECKSPLETKSPECKSPSEIKSPENKFPPRGLFNHNSLEDRHKHAAPPTDL